MSTTATKANKSTKASPRAPAAGDKVKHEGNNDNKSPLLPPKKTKFGLSPTKTKAGGTELYLFFKEIVLAAKQDGKAALVFPGSVNF